MEQMHFLCFQNFNNGSENTFAMKTQNFVQTGREVNRVLVTPTRTLGQLLQRQAEDRNTQTILHGAGEPGSLRWPSPCRVGPDTLPVRPWLLCVHSSLGLGQEK